MITAEMGVAECEVEEEGVVEILAAEDSVVAEGAGAVVICVAVVVEVLQCVEEVVQCEVEEVTECGPISLINSI